MSERRALVGVMVFRPKAVFPSTALVERVRLREPDASVPHFNAFEECETEAASFRSTHYSIQPELGVPSLSLRLLARGSPCSS